MQLHEYLKKAKYPPAGQRKGQWAFNLLDRERPDLAKKIVTTDLDPFYDDKRLFLFLAWVETKWVEG